MEPLRPESLLTRPEAARRLNVGLRQIHEACETGALPVYRVGSWPRVRWRDVLAWLETTREKTG